MTKKIIIFLITFLCIECLKEEVINIKINKLFSETIGKKGTAVLECSDVTSSFNFTDTEKNAFFKSKIINGENSYDVYCGFWISKALSSSLYIFCNIEENIPSGEYSISFNETESFTYNNYTINLIEPEQFLKFTKINDDLMDLYSKEQKINIVEEKDSYEFKFNIVSYNGEKIILNYLIPIDCNRENNILKCPITKSKLEEFLYENITDISISYIDSNRGFFNLPLVQDVEVTYIKTKKEDVEVNIKKLLRTNLEKNAFVAYETDVTSISKISTLEHFYLTFINQNNEKKNKECLLRKYEQNPLYIVCLIKEEGTFYLNQITEEIKVNDINLKYNFKIKPVNYNETFEYKGEGSMLYFFYPEILDFTNKDTFNIIYHVGFPKNIQGITFNEDKEDLECENFGECCKKCVVPKSHFEGKQGGYYFTKYTNPQGGKSISYEISPLKVIMPGDNTGNGNNISLSLFYTLLLILILL